MHIDTDADRIAETSDVDSEAEDLRSLSEVIARLQDLRPDIQDDDLHRAVTRYITFVKDREAADIETHIPTELAALERGNRMYRHPQTSNPEEEFPDDCIDLGCEHVPSACELLARNQNRDALERILDRSVPTEQKVRQLRELATEINCPKLHKLIEQAQPSSSIRKLGTHLLMAVEDRILRQDPASEVLTEAAHLQAAGELDLVDILESASDPDDLTTDGQPAPADAAATADTDMDPVGEPEPEAALDGGAPASGGDG